MATMFYKNMVRVGSEERILVTINYKDEPLKEELTVDQLHHVHILDRSGSMYSSINDLVDHVIETFKVIGDNDIITIIWFSGPGQYRTLIKGARKSDNLAKLMDTMRSVLGTTCFSEPLQEANVIIGELMALCPNVNVTLFSDGQAVVPWSIMEEKRRIMDQVAIMAKSAVAINTIGYGFYYDQELLKSIAGASQFGIAVHSSKIEDYLPIFSHNFERISGMVSDPVKVGSTGAILYLNRRNSRMWSMHTEDPNTVCVQRMADLRQIDKNKNQFFLLSPNGDDFTFSINETMYHSGTLLKSAPESTVRNALYAYAYELYYAGARQEALDIIGKNLKDKQLVDLMVNAFTFEEVEQYRQILRAAVFNNDKRMKAGEAPDGYIPPDDAPCIMDIIRTLVNGGDSYYIPTSPRVEAYARIGRKVTDTFNVFKKTKGDVISPITSFGYHKERLNLSIRFEVPGVVKLNPKAAKSVSLPEEIKSKIYRTHAIVKDGNLNVRNMEVLCDDEVFGKLDKLGVPMLAVTDPLNILDAPEDFDQSKVPNHVILRLEGFPVINRGYVERSTAPTLLQSTARVSDLEARQKVISCILDEVKSSMPSMGKTGMYQTFTVDQVRVLKEHGISDKLIYQGVNRVTPKVDECDFYEVRQLKTYIAGASSLGKVRELIEKVQAGKKKKMNYGETCIINAFSEIMAHAQNCQWDLDKPTKEMRDWLIDQLKTVQRMLLKERSSMSALKLGKILTGDFWTGMQTDDDGNYLYEENGLTLVVKPNREKVYITPESEEAA